ncbi:hypothetical protein [Colwellia sp. BRX9-1]|uniref:hypothetical protein n=1 Tax=Colwellia sp. BRX9-1 TaxID=2759830 RepID=UPI0015F658B5|nr:hypothetical protein [Colwellia sp. BRX9-1]MBA6353613.1 hypothetical protein [Colwellia sp. BRX9-1]
MPFCRHAEFISVSGLVERLQTLKRVQDDGGVGLDDGIGCWLIVLVSVVGGSVCLTVYIRIVTLPFCRHAEFISVSGLVE